MSGKSKKFAMALEVELEGLPDDLDNRPFVRNLVEESLLKHIAPLVSCKVLQVRSGPPEAVEPPSDEAKLHFDFWLDDFEGEMLFAFVQNQISRNLEQKLKLMSGRTPVLYPGATEAELEAYLDWYDRHIAWLEQLKSKLKHERVED